MSNAAKTSTSGSKKHGHTKSNEKHYRPGVAVNSETAKYTKTGKEKESSIPKHIENETHPKTKSTMIKCDGEAGLAESLITNSDTE
jgi:hypothetical protein